MLTERGLSEARSRQGDDSSPAVGRPCACGRGRFALRLENENPSAVARNRPPYPRIGTCMAKTILVVGFGPGISSGVAEKFGKEGFSVALVARSEERLAEGVKSLEAKGVKAAGFTANAADPSSLRAAIAQARDALGPIAVIHWNAYGAEAGDILSASTDEVRAAFDVAVVGLVATDPATRKTRKTPMMRATALRAFAGSRERSSIRRAEGGDG